MRLWSWSAGGLGGMVAAETDHDARRLVRLLIGNRVKIWLIQRKSGEAMPSQPCVVVTR